MRDEPGFNVAVEVSGDFDPREIITGLLAAAVQVAREADIPLDYVTRMAKRMVDLGYDA
jgi:hypothetical protein